MAFEIRIVASFRTMTEQSFHLDTTLIGLQVAERETIVAKEVEKTCLFLDLRGVGKPWTALMP